MAVTDRRLRPRCCHLPGGYFKRTSFYCRYIRTDITCKHDVMNIQQARCGLVAAMTAGSSPDPERPLPATGIPTRQAQGCV